MENCLVIKYKESKLPNVKYKAASWPQLKVYAFPDRLVVIGDAYVIDDMVTELRHYIQSRKQNFYTYCYSQIDPKSYKCQEALEYEKRLTVVTGKTEAKLVEEETKLESK